MENPKISVITVCYNAVDIIEETILSVINQTYSYLEYIVIDGASTDGTVDVVRKYSDRISVFVSEPDKGIYDAMNKGIKVATGDWINFMNAGDTFFSNSILKEVSDYLADGIDILYGDTMLIFSMTKILKHADPIDTIKDKMAFGHQASFINAQFHKSLLYDISFLSSGDYNFFYNAYMNGAFFKYVPLVIANYEAESGISASNYYRVRLEDGRIKGVDGDILFRLRLLFNFIFYRARQVVKKIIPVKFVKRIQLMNYNKLYKE